MQPDPFMLIMQNIANRDTMTRSLMASNASRSNAQAAATAGVQQAAAKAQGDALNGVMNNIGDISETMGSDVARNAVTQGLQQILGTQLTPGDVSATNAKGDMYDKLRAQSTFSDIYKNIADGTGKLVSDAGMQVDPREIVAMDEAFGIQGVERDAEIGARAQVAAASAGGGGGRSAGTVRDNLFYATDLQGNPIPGIMAESPKDAMLMATLAGHAAGSFHIQAGSQQKKATVGGTNIVPINPPGGPVNGGGGGGRAVVNETQLPRKYVQREYDDGTSEIVSPDGKVVKLK